MAETDTTDYILITSRNRWSAAPYGRRYAHISQYDTDLVEFLSPQGGEHILDLGCGMGRLTNKIDGAGAEVIGMDASPTTIERARNIYPHLRFEIADLENFYFPEPFDAVFSNAVLHEVRDPAQVISCVWRVLKPGGRFVAEFPGKGNAEEIISAINRATEAAIYPPKQWSVGWYLPSIGEYASLLERQGLQLTYATLFDRVTPLEDGRAGLDRWIGTFAGDFLAEMPSHGRSNVIENVKNQLQAQLYRNGTWYADYKRIRAVAIKELAPHSGGTM